MNGLINYWSFNGNMYDSVQGVTSTASSGPISYVPDRNQRANSAVNFNSYYVYMANSPNPSSIISAVWWMYMLSQPSYTFIVDCPLAYATGGWPYIILTYSTGMYLYENGIIFMGAGTVPLNVWTHLAIVHTGTNVNLYIGGNVVYTVAAGFPPSGTGQCCFGVCDAGDASWPITSYLDDFYIYNVVLTDAQVTTIMNSYN